MVYLLVLLPFLLIVGFYLSVLLFGLLLFVVGYFQEKISEMRNRYQRRNRYSVDGRERSSGENGEKEQR